MIYFAGVDMDEVALKLSVSRVQMAHCQALEGFPEFPDSKFKNFIGLGPSTDLTYNLAKTF